MCCGGHEISIIQDAVRDHFAELNSTPHRPHFSLTENFPGKLPAIEVIDRMVMFLSRTLAGSTF